MNQPVQLARRGELLFLCAPPFEEIHMKLFVDTGNVKEVEALAALGILDGVTTNPTLLSNRGG